jgi:hypothetical protein
LRYDRSRDHVSQTGRPMTRAELSCSARGRDAYLDQTSNGRDKREKPPQRICRTPQRYFDLCEQQLRPGPNAYSSGSAEHSGWQATSEPVCYCVSDLQRPNVIVNQTHRKALLKRQSDSLTKSL